ncbi:MAG TPA: DUF2630 family protein [Ktedonobacterales bacterium]
MNDADVLRSINELVEEEHHLLAEAEKGGLSEEQRERLHAAQVQLDQCWDLLRQRRARREFGQNPDDAQPRDADTVERYKA